jgi:hypothetical protein
LQANTVVNHIDFDPNLFSTNGTYQADEAAPMLEFLRTGTSLRTIGLAVDPSIEEEIEYEYDFSKPSLQGEILQAVAQNSHIMTFASSVELPQQEFCQFLASPALALKTLRLDGYALDSFEDASLLVDAFGSNRSIQALFLHCTEESGELAEQILRRLDSRCSQSSTMEDVVKVTVKVSEVSVLNHVLHKALCDGLTMNQSIMEMSLKSCYFNKKSIFCFQQFIQARANRGQSKLQTLLYEDLGQERQYRYTYMRLCGETLATMLSRSKLQRLEVGNCTFDARKLYDWLIYRASRIELPALRLSRACLGPPNLGQLVRYLPWTKTLQELWIEVPKQRDDVRQLFLAFRSNGSLRLVRVDLQGRPTPLTFEHYCARNEYLANALREHCEDSSIKAELSLVPFLLVVAQQAFRMAHTTILAGLLALSDDLGEARVDALRTRS